MSSDFDVPDGVPYKGPSGIARDSLWLTSEDIPHDRETIAQIEAVILRKGVKFQGVRVKPICLSLRFVGKSRELALNATNRKTLAALFQSNNTAEWFGRKVALFVEQDVRRHDGTKGPAVRIKAKRIEDSAPPPAADEAAENAARRGA